MEIKPKNLILKRIASKPANEFVKRWHYSGKVVQNSKIHFGVFYNNVLMGVLSYGPPMFKKGLICLVENAGWNDFLELNRMAFHDILPKNSESRCIAVSLRLLKKLIPNIKWVVSFADGTQCGDGCIYRASGFLLSQIKKNTQLRISPQTGEPMQAISAFHKGKTKDFMNWKKLSGYQLRYIYLFDKNLKFNFKILPFAKIGEIGARMYKGQKLSTQSKDSVAV